MTHLKLIPAFVLAVLLLAFQAQTTFAGNDTHYKAAYEMVEATYNSEFLINLVNQFSAIIVDAAMSKNLKKAQYKDVLAIAVKDVMRKSLMTPEVENKIRETFALVYEEEFSEKELREITAFYNTSVGRKCIKTLPILMQNAERKVAQFVGPVLETTFSKNMSARIEKLKAQGTLPKDF